jgi:hypothetical protein
MRKDDYYPFYFGRNNGIYSEADVEKIRRAKIGIAGLGGSGGYSLLFLTHMGFEHFKVADLDVYEEHNKNRQVGAFAQNIGRPKTDTLVEMARSLNPYIQVEVYDRGIRSENAESFVDGTDFVIETMDFNVPDAKFSLHEAAMKSGKYISTSPSPVYGAPVFNFGPGTRSFGESFGLDRDNPFATKTDARRFLERLVLPVIAEYPQAEKERILAHLHEAAVGERHLPTNIMGVTSSAQLLCMAFLETVLYGAPKILMPNVLILDHLTFQYKSISMDAFDWKN